jgi:peroxiredoxin
MHRTRALLPAALAALVALGCAARSANPAEDKGPARATDFSLRSVDGRTFRLSDHLGKDVILLSFWATWCVPCLGEMPELEKIYRDHKAQGFTVVGLSMDGPESIANVEPTVRRYGVTYPIVLDEETRVTAVYNPARDAPYAVLIDRSGRIVERKLGYAPGDEVKLKEEIVKLLAAAPAGAAP